MKKQSFMQRLSKLEQDAMKFIEAQFTGRKRVIHLCDPDTESGENEIYDMPTFDVHGKYGFCENCNAYKLAKRKENGVVKIFVYGISRENGNQEYTELQDIYGSDLVYLASHFEF